MVMMVIAVSWIRVLDKIFRAGREFITMCL
jgi:hypothetical protein